VIKDVKSGKGTIGKLINDTLISIKINKIMSNFLSASDSFVIVSSNLKRISEKLNNQNNTMGKLLNDTVFARNLDKSMENLKNGSESFNKDMKAVQYSWPFKKGIRKLK
jgi:phospholipid/cholesterol/gamma-HCH transport system substrate-binding protein